MACVKSNASNAYPADSSKFPLYNSVLEIIKWQMGSCGFFETAFLNWRNNVLLLIF